MHCLQRGRFGNRQLTYGLRKIPATQNAILRILQAVADHSQPSTSHFILAEVRPNQELDLGGRTYLLRLSTFDSSDQAGLLITFRYERRGAKNADCDRNATQRIKPNVGDERKTRQGD